jgi:hypothetical protein
MQPGSLVRVNYNVPVTSSFLAQQPYVVDNSRVMNVVVPPGARPGALIAAVTPEGSQIQVRHVILVVTKRFAYLLQCILYCTKGQGT